MTYFPCTHLRSYLISNIPSDNNMGTLGLSIECINVIRLHVNRLNSERERERHSSARLPWKMVVVYSSPFSSVAIFLGLCNSKWIISNMGFLISLEPWRQTITLYLYLYFMTVQVIRQVEYERQVRWSIWSAFNASEHRNFDCRNSIIIPSLHQMAGRFLSVTRQRWSPFNVH